MGRTELPVFVLSVVRFIYSLHLPASSFFIEETVSYRREEMLRVTLFLLLPFRLNTILPGGIRQVISVSPLQNTR